MFSICTNPWVLSDKSDAMRFFFHSGYIKNIMTSLDKAKQLVTNFTFFFFSGVDKRHYQGYFKEGSILRAIREMKFTIKYYPKSLPVSILVHIVEFCYGEFVVQRARNFYKDELSYESERTVFNDVEDFQNMDLDIVLAENKGRRKLFN